MSKQLIAGLFGFGVVGEGIYKVLQQTETVPVFIKKVCIRDASKKRNAPAALFTSDPLDILDDPDINLVIELIDDASVALEIVSKALASGKAVVTANKRMLAENLPELLALQKQSGAPLLYEAAVCGSIPIIRNLEEYYDNDMLQGICGIVNGSTNYILTRMLQQQENFPSALLAARQAGFAEADPSLDVKGIDAVNKLVLLLLHGYGIVSAPDQLLHRGIDGLRAGDAAYAREKGWRIKLLAQARKNSRGEVAAFVLPHYVDAGSRLHKVDDEYNGVVLQGAFADKQFLCGKGAGRYPTSSAVLSDLSALRYRYKYEYRKLRSSASRLSFDFYLRVSVSYNDIEEVNRADFNTIEAFHFSGGRYRVEGLIHCKKLQAATWWRQPTVSVVALPNSFVEAEEVALKEVRSRSLKLSGSVEPVSEFHVDRLLLKG